MHILIEVMCVMKSTQRFSIDGASAFNEHGFDPALTDQFETTLGGVYEYNADTAKFGVIWVSLARVLMIGAGVGGLVSLLVGLILIINGRDIDFGTPEIDPIHAYDWSIWLAVAIGLGLVALFMAFITKAVSRSHRVSIELASRFRDARS